MGTGADQLSLPGLIEWLRERTRLYHRLCTQQAWEQLQLAMSDPEEQAAWRRLQEYLEPGDIEATGSAQPAGPVSWVTLLQNLYSERRELQAWLEEQKAHTLAALLALQQSRPWSGHQGSISSLGQRLDQRG